MTMVVCTSGFSVLEKKSVEIKVLELGGVFENDLTTQASVLISKRQGTTKSKAAFDLGIPVISESWIADSSNQGSFIKKYKRYILPLLAGIKIWPYNLNISTKNQIKKLGGLLLSSQSGCFCAVTDTEHQKIAKLCLPEVKIVTTNWIEDIINQNKWIDIDIDYNKDYEPKKQMLYLSRYIFYIDNVKEEEAKIIREIIILGGGTYMNSVHPLITHVITQKTSKNNFLNAAKLTPTAFKEACLNKVI